MDTAVLTQDPLELSTPLLAVPVPLLEGEALPGGLAELDRATGGGLASSLARGDFDGRKEDSLLVFPQGVGGPARIVFFGTGDPAEFDAEGARRFAGRAVRQAEALRVTDVTLWLDGMDEAHVQAAAEGGVLAAWRFDEFRSADDDDPKPAVDSVQAWLGGSADGLGASFERGVIIGEGENFARNLQNRPGNAATPTYLAEQAERMASEAGLTFRALGPAEMHAEGMGALLAVAQGSDEEPRLIILEHRGGNEDDAPVALVGKGLTFDAGGISLKPPAKMEDMKFDMSGGAAVLGAMKAIGELDLPINVVAAVPSSENLLNGSAMKPGDIITTREGKTVEIINTDAEGRLILSDALSYVREYEPAAIVDCATLTGAVVIGLGHHAAAVLGTDDDLVQELRDAGDRSGERCWPLPLWPEYREQLKSDYADMKNVGGRPAGTITAGWFLREFVGDTPWGHLDVAGTAYGEGKLPYQRPGGYGFPTRLLVEWVRARAR
jgi:leucyl aminopeptidase